MSRFILALILFGLSTGIGFGQEVTVELTNSIGMKLLLIPKGSFMMGSSETEKERDSDEVQHEVMLSKDFYLGVTEVTQAQYQKVMSENPSEIQDGKTKGDRSNHPVEQISWEEAVKFCQRMSDLPDEKKAGRVYRLPTEAEWEYACRAGSKATFCFGDNESQLGDFAWYRVNSNAEPHSVGLKKPNSWGLHDMHGNVWELCSDWYGDYPKGAVSDPNGPKEGSGRVNRGGTLFGTTASCRSANRNACDPLDRSVMIGFRVALSFPEIEK